MDTTETVKVKKTLISAVKKFVKALGGQDNDSDNLVEVIDKAADDISEGSESGSSSENGMVISVIGPGSSAEFYLEKTWQEIYDLLSNGTTLYIKWPDTNSYGGYRANGIYQIAASFLYDSSYSIIINHGISLEQFSCNTTDGHPTVYYD